MNKKIEEIIIGAVEKASLVCRRIQTDLVGGDTQIKSDRSPVTIADYAAQAIVCETIHEAYPDIAIVAEEQSDYLQTSEGRGMVDRILAFLPEFSADDLFRAIDLGGGDSGGTFVTLDPIDGTKGFLRGEQFAVAAAVIQDGRPEMGVLGCPNLRAPGSLEDGILCYSDFNNNAWMRPIHSSEVHALDISGPPSEQPLRFLESVESGHAAHDFQERIMTGMDAAYKSVRLDSQAKYAALAMGQADIYLRLPKPGKQRYIEKIWDHAAGVHLVVSAGGRVTDMHGHELDFGQGRGLSANVGVVASAGPNHDRLIATIQDAAVV